MPPLPSVPNVIKFAIECQGNDGRSAVNVTHFTYGGGLPTSTDIESMCQNIWNSWVSDFIPNMPAQTSLVNITGTDLSSDTGATAEYNNAGVPVAGTSVSGMVPLNSCMLISKFVARRYRGGHSRSYLPIGTTADLNDDGDWKATFATDARASWQDLVHNLQLGSPYGAISIGLECAVSYVSKVVNPVYPYRRAVPLVMDIPDDGYTAQTKIATQRRRVRRYR